MRETRSVTETDEMSANGLLVDLHLRFFVRGVALDPDALTNATGVEPSQSFRAGSVRAGRTRAEAGWYWSSEPWTSADLEGLFAVALDTLGPHEAHFAECVENGCSISLSLGGVYYAPLIETDEEADALKVTLDLDGPFRRFIDAERIGIVLPPRLMLMLGRLNATFTTHIDIELIDER
jgi:hypothetical protein